MLYLADIRHDFKEKTLHLKLLAQCQSEQVWQVLTQPEFVQIKNARPPALAGLVLVELEGDPAELGKAHGSSTQIQNVNIQDATDWLLDVMNKFLKTGVTAEFLQAETARAEQWRQALTLQSQELGRRTLELEARMGQIQELEEKLQHDRQDAADDAPAAE
jgi:hypothetical protein